MKQRKDYRAPLERFNEKYIPEPNTGCWLWTSTWASCGYGQFRINGKYWLAHRASWKLLYGEIPGGLQVLHKCDVRPCVNPDHLFLGTQSDNMLDCFKKGRRANILFKMPQKNKLTIDQINSILEIRKTGITMINISKMFNVSESLIHRACHGTAKPKKI